MKVYDLSGRVSLGVLGGDPRTLEAVARQMDPFVTGGTAVAGRPDVVLELSDDRPSRFLEVHNPARDGMTTAYDGRDLHLVAGGRSCAIVPSPDGGLTLRCPPSFPLGPLFRTVVRPTLQVAATGHDTAAVHSAAVEIDGRAVLVAGWSESGKTETALALVEEGAGWLSDKWTLLGGDGEASAFPVNVGVRRWVLPFLPRLAGALPRPARAQVALAGVVARTTRPLRRGSAAGGRTAAAAVAERAVGLVDRAALSTSEIRAAYGQTDDPTRRLELGTLVLLTTVPGSSVSVETGAPGWAARRLALTAAYERHDWHMLQDRLRYADPWLVGDGRGRTVDAECRILERALAGARVLHVRAPFPVDPRRVVSALREAL
ncbi:hypothetical protein SAMN05660464_2147 [Geodermatophilus dictyosporus]|uniref:HPr kinase n=1 Tax=Geodermatophilus dictyosporus TaxID=1523247 RepID=A0A1I5MTQ5_9ACTN|nr:hypothetical protein [Geodermatophilus dictyosporus]SFP12938.1 hypothetical protein SAMN05660464_2147 [Geodermatophilus dictyosporus]